MHIHHGPRSVGITLLVIIGLIQDAPVLAQDKGSLPVEVAIIPQDAAAFAQFRPADLWHGTSFGGQGIRKLFPQLAEEVARGLGDDPADTEIFTVIFPGASLLQKRAENAQPDEQLIIVETTVKPLQQADVVGRVLGEGAIEKQHLGKTYWVSGPKAGFFRKGAVLFVSDRTYVYAMSPAMMPGIIAKAGEPRKTNGPLAAALELATKQQQLVIGLNLTEPGVQKQIKDLRAELKRPGGRDMPFDIHPRMPFDEPPRGLGDVPPWLIIPLLDAQSASCAVEIRKDRLRVQSGVTFADAQQADRARKALDDLLGIVRIMLLGQVRHELTTSLDFADNRADLFFLIMVLQQADEVLRSATIERRQATVRVQAEAQFDLASVRGKAKIAADNYVESEAVRRARIARPSVNNLKELTQAMHMYHDVFATFPPPVICGKDGKPLLSWRVAILPYLGQKELFDEFKLEEPWDSPHNIKLLPRMPQVFAPPRMKTKEPHTTLYQVFTGPGTMFEFVPDKDSRFGAKGCSMIQVTDGTTNTLMIVEAHDPVAWSKPADLSFEPKKPLPGIGGTLIGDGFHGSTVDGAVHFFKQAKPGTTVKEAASRGELSEETLRDAITRADGNVLGIDFWGKGQRRFLSGRAAPRM